MSEAMSVEEWENRIETLIKHIQDFELACNMKDTFDAGRVSGLQYARGHLSTLLGISKGTCHVDHNLKMNRQ